MKRQAGREKGGEGGLEKGFGSCNKYDVAGWETCFDEGMNGWKGAKSLFYSNGQDEGGDERAQIDQVQN